MNKRILIYALPFVALGILWLFWPEKKNTNKEDELKKQAERAAMAANPASGEYRTFVDENKRLFSEENMYTFNQLMEMARLGRISLVSELWQLRTKCGTEGGSEEGGSVAEPRMSYEECNVRIENFLREEYPAPDNDKLVQLYRNYIKYEDAMRRLSMPDETPIAERLSTIRKKRREFFSEKDAHLIFGYEEAQQDAIEALTQFVASSHEMPAEDRIKKYYGLRKKILGDYNTYHDEIEPAFTKYETETLLRSDEMRRKGDLSRETQAMREKYFGEEGAKRMEKVEAEIRTERERVERYEGEAQAFKRANPGLSESELKDKLAAIRESAFGKEGAKEYERRMQYEEYLRVNNLK